MFEINCFVIILLAVTGSTQAVDLPNEVLQAATIIHNTCRDRVGVKEEILQHTKTGELPNDRELQCYIDCIFREIDVIDKTGQINFSHIYYILPDEVVEIIDGITKTCGTVHGNDACETAWLTAKCYFEADPNVKRITAILE